MAHPAHPIHPDTTQLHVRAPAAQVAQLRLASGGVPDAVLVRAGLKALEDLISQHGVERLQALISRSIQPVGRPKRLA